MHIYYTWDNSFQRIYYLLANLEAFYVPPLSLQVCSIKDYAKKLSQKADTIVATINNNDIGILSIYCNNFNENIAYISTFCIHKNYHGMGVADTLLDFCLNYLKQKKYYAINLEVEMINKRAFAFYCKKKFKIINNYNEKYLMQLTFL